MKTVTRPLLIAVLALSILSISKAYAGPGDPPFTTHHRSWDDLPYFDHQPNNFVPVFRDDDRNQVNDDRRYWNDRPCDPGHPQPSGGGGNSVPLDGGITLLLAAGLGLGLKMAMAKTKV